jgi:hypothetical protein
MPYVALLSDGLSVVITLIIEVLRRSHGGRPLHPQADDMLPKTHEFLHRKYIRLFIDILRIAFLGI